MIWGRNIYCNIQRFLQFQVTACFSLIITMVLGYITLTETPLGAVKLIWINQLIDLIATIMLASELPHPDLKTSWAFNKNTTHVLSAVVWRQIYALTIWMAIVMSINIFFGEWLYDLKYDTATQITDTDAAGNYTPAAEAKMQHLSVIYNTFMFLQIFNLLNCRVVGVRDLNPLKGIFRDWTFPLFWILIVLFQIGTVFYGHFLFQTVPITGWELLISCLWGFSPILVSFFVKLTPSDWVDKIPTKMVDEN